MVVTYQVLLERGVLFKQKDKKMTVWLQSHLLAETG